MNCQHHPDYDPASGEPTGTITSHEGGHIPCPYCWQARAKWLKDELEIWQEAGRQATVDIRKRIAELEGRLAEKHQGWTEEAAAHLETAHQLAEATTIDIESDKELTLAEHDFVTGRHAGAIRILFQKYVNRIREAEKREAVLEGQLARADQSYADCMKAFDRSSAEFVTQLDANLKYKKGAEQREAVLREDKQRLDFITEQTYSLSRITLDEVIHWDVLEVGACKCMGRGKTPREAIDKARAASGPKRSNPRCPKCNTFHLSEGCPVKEGE